MPDLRHEVPPPAPVELVVMSELAADLLERVKPCGVRPRPEEPGEVCLVRNHGGEFSRLYAKLGCHCSKDLEVLPAAGRLLFCRGRTSSVSWTRSGVGSSFGAAASTRGGAIFWTLPTRS